jgi:hypothetical protein
MQCPRCGAITADDALDTRYCSNCGAVLNEASGPAARVTNQDASAFPGVQIDRQPAGEAPMQAMNASDVTMLATPPDAPVAASLPVPPSLPSINSEPMIEAGWSEFSGAPLAASMPTGAEAAYPSPGEFSYSSPNAYPQMVPGAYSSPNLYPQQSVSGTYPPQVAPGGYPYAYAPGFLSPQPPTPKRGNPVLAIVLSVLVILLIAGGVFAGLAIGLAHSKTSTTTAQTTPTATAAPDAQQLYQQVISQSPYITDSLQDATTSRWAVYEKPVYGCEIKSDGLHVHTQHAAHFAYCTSGQGEFNNFAFQVDMKIVSGKAGGITFRMDGENYYTFYANADGSYMVYVIQNNQAGSPLGAGKMTSFNAGAGQKNTLTLIAQDDQIYLYVNGTNFAQIQDSTYSGGDLGVIADDHDAPAEVVYTNAKIWRL